MSGRRIPSEFLLNFTPELWPSVKKFGQFIGPPYGANRELSKGTHAANCHIAKYSALAGLANRLKDQLAEDDAELAEKGYSHAGRSKEFAALVETLYCELYAALDGVRRTLFGAYGNVRGVQNKSTEKSFLRMLIMRYMVQNSPRTFACSLQKPSLRGSQVCVRSEQS
jgi:hypothetical protein